MVSVEFFRMLEIISCATMMGVIIIKLVIV